MQQIRPLADRMLKRLVYDADVVDGVRSDLSFCTMPLDQPKPLDIVVPGMTAEKRVETQGEHASEKLYRAIVETASEGIWTIDENDVTTFVNQSLAKMLGYEPEEMVGKPVLDFIDPAHHEEEQRNLARRREGIRERHELRFRAKDRSEVWTLMATSSLYDAEGAYAGALAMVTDITAQRLAGVENQRAQEAIRHQALHDTLTGLPNRALFLDRVDHALRRIERDRQSLAVFFIDLDQFKLVNDSLGHDAGDALLRLVAPRLASAVRPGDTVARLGGDEFAVVCEELAEEEEATRIAKELRAVLEQPVVA